MVKQRLRLGAVSPKLIQVYRDGGLTMDQLQAFAITDDHDRQEQVYENLSHNKEPWIIRRDLTASNVAASDRRAAFVGAEAYTEAGGNIIRDLTAHRKLPWEQHKRHAHATADRLATAVALDMTAYWTPTVRAFFGRVTKAQILAAVREALGNEAAERIADKKKPEMAEAAEQLLAGTGWLPPMLRTERPAWLAVDEQQEALAMEDEPFTVAAE